ncbi:1-acyl-sn-glycerol-3-phosphate acyltransferase [Pseudoroseomonas cervicalis]|uniref:lysophospholipid acyltransferase family protein n=1 Tax=Teichococcus cervicalis TaxID=204525 RepID=UPI0022F14FA6|nr:lysophospholipid acyltransferase family protein [Pseudoroseomonas cervicalis]WBV42644.1 lysophospholipid acyltransferase family protein [Pseudoroseomonas cervicalis]
MILLRSALFNALFFTLTALACILGLALLPFPRRVLRRFIQGWARLILWLLKVVCGIGLRVTGREHLPDGPVVIAAKHQSAYDTVVWLALLPEPVYVLKQELLKIPAWGRLARHYGSVAVDRKGGASALKRMVRQAAAALAEGDQIVIFPEGTRTLPGQRIPYQPGVVALAAASPAPVVPVATDSGLHWGRGAFAAKQPGDITVAILPPLPSGLGRAALLSRLEAAIEAETDRLVRQGGGPAVQPPLVDNSVG